jgi:predicted RND superfamily exporter protein
MDGNHTAEELLTLATTGTLEGTDLTMFQIKQMYGLYFFNDFDNDNVDFMTMLRYINEMAESEEFAGLMDEQTKADLVEFETNLTDFQINMAREITKEEFQGYAVDQFGHLITPFLARIAAGNIFDNYQKEHGNKNVYPTIDLLEYTVKEDLLGSIVTNKDLKDLIENSRMVYEEIQKDCAYEDFLPLIDKAVLALTGETREINATTEAVQQGYIMYFEKQGVIPNKKANGRDFITFVNATIATNDVVKGRISAESVEKLSDLGVVDAYLTSDERFLADEMSENIAKLQSEIKSLDATNSISGSEVLNIYTKYAISDGTVSTAPVISGDLLDFVVSQMDTNEQLKSRMTEEHRAKVIERQAAVKSAEKLFLGKQYGRMILSIDLPSESKESTEFVEHLIVTVKEVFGEDAHVAGHMVSTVDLQNSFAKDNTIITIVTIISIFLIIMLIFRSLSLPVLLVIVIQGAIWISMATSLITGPMFFMSYIITTCILMGATIDYGILMSSTYVAARREMDKKEALLVAVNTALPTVFTSGLILTICGFIVGFVASQTSISTVGILLGKGALVSSLMVMLVLPSILYLLDKFILKLSVQKK